MYSRDNSPSNSDNEYDNSYDADSESGYFSDADNESVGSSDSARWRKAEDDNDRQEELNVQLIEAIEEGNHRKVEEILEYIDESRIDIDNNAVRKAITENDDLDLFEVIRDSFLAPSQSNAMKWVKSIVSQKCEKVAESILEYFKVSDAELFNFIDLKDAAQIEFYLKYLFREHDTNPRFNKEIAKCVKLLSGSNIELNILEAMGKESERYGKDSFQYKIRKQLLDVFEESDLKNDRDDLIQQAISKKCEFAEQVFTHFEVSDIELFEIVDLTEDEEISFYLRYVLRHHKDHPKFNAEIKNCIDLLKNDEVELRIITALCHEAKHHEEGDIDCQIRRDLLKIFDPKLAEKPIAELAAYLKSQETAKRDLFGANLTDDSDSDLSDTELPQARKDAAKKLVNKANIDKLKKEMIPLLKRKESLYKEETFSSKFPPYPFSYSKSDQAIKDLKVLNDKYNEAKNKGKVQELLNSLETKFSLLYFRGISHYTTLWSQPARRHHRKLNEVGHTLFATAALQAAGITTDDLRKHSQESIEKKAKPHSEKLIKFKDKLEAEKDIYIKDYRNNKFSNLLYFFHELYTSVYKKFSEFLEYIKSGIKGNPLVSAGETARHPFHYALGIKVYKDEKDKRIRPRYNQDSRCERPHSGKIYFINIPLEELSSTAMVSIPQLNFKGEIFIHSTIIAEREAAFWGMIKGKWVIDQASARYPSFDKKYNPKYLEKYGLTAEVYGLFSKAFKTFAPHTKENEECEFLLGTYLSAFYEQKAMKYCKDYTSNKSQPVFLGMDGKFTFELGPYTPFEYGGNNLLKQVTRESANTRRANKQIDLKDVKPRILDFSK